MGFGETREFQIVAADLVQRRKPLNSPSTTWQWQRPTNDGAEPTDAHPTSAAIVSANPPIARPIKRALVATVMSSAPRHR